MDIEKKLKELTEEKQKLQLAVDDCEARIREINLQQRKLSTVLKHAQEILFDEKTEGEEDGQG